MRRRTTQPPLTPRQAKRLTRRLMPEDGDLKGFLRNLGDHLGKRIVLLKLDRESLPLFENLPSSTSGVCLALDQGLGIFIDESGGPSRRALIVAHEVAHILLGHPGRPGPSNLIDQLTPKLGSAVPARIFYRCENTPDESAAEELATVIAAEHGRRQRSALLNSNPFSARLR